MKTNMSKLYEKAWNQVVNKLPDWKKKIIIENFPYPNVTDARISQEVAHEATQMAELWEEAESVKK